MSTENDPAPRAAPPETGPTGKTAGDLQSKIDRFPQSAGVYLLKDGRGRIIYIGKAVNLRARVRSYFTAGGDTRIFHQFISQRAADVDCLVTSSEAEALILENNLIKKNRPVYNIRLKDDKTYVSLKVTLDEEWPRVQMVRGYKKDGGLYFGPYSSASAVREVLRVIKTTFPLRSTSCTYESPGRPCMEYEIGRCSAPIAGMISKESYMEAVREVILFLRGRNRELIERLKARMAEAAEARRYEVAARCRDQIRAVEKVFQSQKAQEIGSGDVDAFAGFRSGQETAIQEVVVRDGKVIHSHCHLFRSSLPLAEVLGSFLAQYYLAERYIPPEVLCGSEFPDREVLEASLGERRGGPVTISVPQRGKKLELVEMARSNAENFFQVERTRAERMDLLIASLKERLGLRRPPRAIECFDISNFQGTLAVGAQVRFEDGQPARDRYRKYKVRTVPGADDFRMMEEVLRRRLTRGLAEGGLPDLVLVDGGKGQLSVAVKLLAELNVPDLEVLALAKERRARGTVERVYAPGRPDPLPLPPDSPESLYLQRIRDETHRFAVTYHRHLRRRRTLATGLEEIPGIGGVRRRALIERFRTLDRIKAATIEEIAEVVGDRLAEAVVAHLNRVES